MKIRPISRVHAILLIHGRVKLINAKIIVIIVIS